MSAEAHLRHPLSPKAILAIGFGALLLDTVILFGGVLPAELMGPARVGRVSGLNRLWAPRHVWSG